MRHFALFVGLSIALWASQITIAVAANVSYAIDALKKAFTQHYPNVRVRTIIGSSGKLAVQIRNGAPYDIYMSADMAYPQRLFQEGNAITEPRIYAKGALALLSPIPRKLDRDLQILRAPSIRRIAIANPKTAPYGKAAAEALKNAKLYNTVRSKLIFAESISQTLAYTLHAADVGIVAKSSLFSPKLSHFQKAKTWVEVDPKLYAPIDQGIVMLLHAKESTDARAFYDFIFTKKARSIFQAYGYLLP